MSPPPVLRVSSSRRMRDSFSMRLGGGGGAGLARSRGRTSGASTMGARIIAAASRAPGRTGRQATATSAASSRPRLRASARMRSRAPRCPTAARWTAPPSRDPEATSTTGAPWMRCPSLRGSTSTNARTRTPRSRSARAQALPICPRPPHHDLASREGAFQQGLELARAKAVGSVARVGAGEAGGAVTPEQERRLELPEGGAGRGRTQPEVVVLGPVVGAIAAEVAEDASAHHHARVHEGRFHEEIAADGGVAYEAVRPLHVGPHARVQASRR